MCMYTLVGLGGTLEGIGGDLLEVSDKRLFRVPQGFLKDLTCRMPMALLHMTFEAYGSCASFSSKKLVKARRGASRGAQ